MGEIEQEQASGREIEQEPVSGRGWERDRTKWGRLGER